MNTSVIDMSRASQERQPVSESTALVQVIERAARDPNIDIDKMERLLAMQERIFDRNAAADYNAAMAACQAEMPQIVPRSNNSQTNSLYAALEEIDRIARPVYTKHGFALSFGTADCPIQSYYRQTCKVSHRGGHSEERQADLPIDTVGIKGTPNKTGVQGFGSTMTYGQRYITKLVFNIVIGGLDDDGNSGGDPVTNALQEVRKHAKTYADRFIKAIEEGKDELIVELKDELRGQQELELAIWSQLPAPVRRKIKDVLAAPNGAA